MAATRYDNPETAQKLRDRIEQDRREEEREIVEGLTLKQRLQQKRDESTIEQEFLGETIEFREPGAGLQRRGLEISAEFGGQDEDEIDPETSIDLLDFMIETLGELSTDESLDADFWDDFGFGQLEELFESIILDTMDEDEIDEEMAEEIDQFRGE